MLCRTAQVLNSRRLRRVAHCPRFPLRRRYCHCIHCVRNNSGPRHCLASRSAKVRSGRNTSLCGSSSRHRWDTDRRYRRESKTHLRRNQSMHRTCQMREQRHQRRMPPAASRMSSHHNHRRYTRGPCKMHRDSLTDNAPHFQCISRVEVRWNPTGNRRGRSTLRWRNQRWSHTWAAHWDRSWGAWGRRAAPRHTHRWFGSTLPLRRSAFRHTPRVAVRKYTPAHQTDLLGLHSGLHLEFYLRLEATHLKARNSRTREATGVSREFLESAFARKRRKSVSESYRPSLTVEFIAVGSVGADSSAREPAPQY